MVQVRCVCQYECTCIMCVWWGVSHACTYWQCCECVHTCVYVCVCLCAHLCVHHWLCVCIYTILSTLQHRVFEVAGQPWVEPVGCAGVMAGEGRREDSVILIYQKVLHEEWPWPLSPHTVNTYSTHTCKCAHVCVYMYHCTVHIYTDMCEYKSCFQSCSHYSLAAGSASFTLQRRLLLHAQYVNQ